MSFTNKFFNIHGWFCFHLYNTPFLNLLPSHIKALQKKNMQSFLSMRTDKLVLENPPSHCIHVFKPAGKVQGKILINHGWCCSALDMFYIISHLVENGYQIYAMDFPGHGESKGHYVQWSESLMAIARAEVNLGPFDAEIGHSYGGAILLSNFCIKQANAQRTIPKMVLMGAPFKVVKPLKTAGKILRMPARSYRAFRKLVRKHHEIPVGESSKYIHGCCFGDINRFSQYKENIDIETYDSKALSMQSKSRFLVVHGKRDALISPVDSISFCERNPQATLVLDRQRGHMDILHNDKIFEEILTFIQRPDKDN